MGVGLGQGYYLGEPAPFESAVWLAAQVTQSFVPGAR
jgi:EAL domain-containing protein (putative c-di-GMP-specific phosphodiesterase class I)